MVGVLVVGTQAMAKRPLPPPDLEPRVTALEEQVADHETRLQAEEQNTAGQNQRLDSLEQEQQTQNDRLDALESQASPAAGGIKVYDSHNSPQFVGFLVAAMPKNTETLEPYAIAEAHLIAFMPTVGKFIELKWNSTAYSSERTTLRSVYFDDVGCLGNAYVLAGSDDSQQKLMRDSHFLFYQPSGRSYYSMAHDVAPDVQLLSQLDWSGACWPISVIANCFALSPVDVGFTELVPPLKFEF